MNNKLKYTGILLLAILINITATAQKIDGYTISMAPTYLGEPGKIYIENFENLGDIEENFGANYVASLKNVLEYTTVNATAGVKLYNPWLTTKLYTIVDSEDEANYIIKGTYLFTKSNSSSYNANMIHETTGTNKLPIHYYKYSTGASASIVFNMGLYAKGNDTPLREYPFSDKKDRSESKNFSKPIPVSTNPLVKKLTTSVENKYLREFSPRLVVVKYKFKRIKPSDKSLKKDYKAKRKSLIALAKNHDIKGMGKIYLEMLNNDANDTDIHENLGICYELIGNYTKAKEFYVKSGDKDGISRITYLIKVQEIFVTVGIDVSEGEF
ncbi:MAG: hypothetical protein U9Q83_04985 [Bacteroidota bacterium]|nr:hypothetical protein [Bacteroidota bacterium]